MDQICTDQILSDDYTDFIFDATSDFRTRLTNPEICYTNLSFGFTIGHVPVNLIPSNFLHEFGYRIIPHCLGLLDTGSLEASGITRLRNIPNFNLRGQGVLIGIIDTGIDYTHNAFKDEAGGSRIISIWDQTIQSDAKPAGFSFGTEYTSVQINEALKSDNPLSVVPSMDENGHGTLLAGIAAGTPNDENNFSGVVPNSEIVVVKLKTAKSYIRNFWVIPNDVICYQENDILLGLEYLRSIATRLNRPLSICISLGTSQGSHDGTSVFSRYLSLLSLQIGIAIVVAGGNEGNRGHHFFGSVLAESDYQTVEMKVGPEETGFTMQLWGYTGNTYSIDIQSPSGEYIPRIPASLSESREVRFLFEFTTINVDYFLVETQTGAELILMRFRNPTEGIWRFKVYSQQKVNADFHIWLPINTFIGEQTFFTTPNPDTTLTSPANTIRPIVTTAYDYSTQSLYLYTSRGFTREGYISPDISAPGVNLIGPSLNNGYSQASGTSIAAAHTAGVAAMFLEWGIINKNYLTLDTMQISIFLRRGAKRFPNINYPDTGWGYGALDIYGTFLNLRGETS